ncbi:sensor histidine kinase [Epilithonimonas caeni]|uniref:sensor histidine kinase n=1 Tax=Epilithonimonas caeni TaxID=365343 RepID=UPI000480DADA|nr:histidine kinase [Epilithonimonas caeni]
MTLLKNWKYHVFTITYLLSTIFFFLTFKKLIYTELYSKKHLSLYIFELFFVTFLLYIISNIVIYFIELFSLKQLFSFRNIALIIGIVLILHVIFQIMLWPFLIYAQNFLVESEARFEYTADQTFDKRIVNYFYFLFITINWLVFICAYKIYKSKQEDLKQKLSIEKNLKDAHLNTLKGQINPHFIFNSLNNIRGLVQEDPLKSKEMITRLSELLRSSLLLGKTNFVTVEQEMETVENFLEISKIQYEDRLSFQFDILDKTKSIQIPPMILQMLVENAVKHGISTLKNGGNILIKTYLDKNDLQIIVKNTGKISQIEGSTKIGLQNIEERLKLLYDENATFKLSENNDEVIAEISINSGNINI